MATTIELRQRRANLWEEAKGVHARAEKNNGVMTAEDRQEWDRINSDIDLLKERIDREERATLIETELAAMPEPVIKPQPQIREIQHGREVERHAKDKALPDDGEYREAFGGYLRQGLGGMRPEMRAIIQPYYGAVDTRALGTGTTGAGGALVPEDFYRRMLEAMKAFGGMRQAPTTKLTTASGASLPIPLADDTDNEGEILGQGSNTNTTGTDPAFGSKPLGAFMYTSKLVRVSFQLLQDSAFDLETWLANALGRRIGRVTNRHFTTGEGGDEPEGILTVAGEGVTGGDLTDYLDLVALEHSVDPSYRANGAGWMFHDTALALLKQIKGDNGQPLWLPGVAVASPDTILGYSYWINQSMPQAEPGAKALLFGDFSYYFIRDVADARVLRLEERFAEYLQVGFLAFQRSDGMFATPSEVVPGSPDPNPNVPVKYMELAGGSS